MLIHFDEIQIVTINILYRLDVCPVRSMIWYCRLHLNFLFDICFFFFFFFQAEDGIRDWSVTGVQTCALPIFFFYDSRRCSFLSPYSRQLCPRFAFTCCHSARELRSRPAKMADRTGKTKDRSEERRVGKECRSRWEEYD